MPSRIRILYDCLVKPTTTKQVKFASSLLLTRLLSVVGHSKMVMDGSSNCLSDYLVTEDGKMKLDRSKFDQTINVPFLEVDKKNANSILLHLKPYLFKGIKINPVWNGTNHDNRATATDVKDDGGDKADEDKKRCSRIEVSLNPDKVKTINDLSDEVINKFKMYNHEIDLKFKDVHLTYENLTVEQVFRRILPFEGVENLSSFSTIGHIIHLNLRDHLLPFKHVIGEVLLDKHRPRIRLVVNKINEIDTEFRFFKMETLANDSNTCPDDTIVTVKHAKCEFKFDFAKVYWNPRLDTEHTRIIDKLRPGMDVLYDVFAGVGPFSIPCGKRKCQVLANDLNPECVKWMDINVKHNKVDKFVQVFNLDGREFIRRVIKNHVLNEWKQFDAGHETKCNKFHVTMNLPGLAIDFLDAFKNFFNEEETREIMELKSFQCPIIHCYTFMRKESKDDEDRIKTELIKRVNEKLDHQLTDDDIEEIKFVRNVAPNKEMYRISFNLPKEVTLSSRNVNKKLRVD